MHPALLATLVSIALVACSPTPRATHSKPATESPPLVYQSDQVQLDVACVPTSVEICFDAVDNNCNGAIEEGCGVRTGIIQFSVAWSDPEADVDLLVADPKGEIARVNDATELGLLKDRDCPGERDACQGQNMENVFLVRRELPRGTFRVAIRLTRLGQNQPPLSVRFGVRMGQRSYASVLKLTAVGDEKLVVFEM